MPSCSAETVSPSLNGLPHMVGLPTYTVFSGIFQPLVRLRCIRFGVIAAVVYSNQKNFLIGLHNACFACILVLHATGCLKTAQAPVFCVISFLFRFVFRLIQILCLGIQYRMASIRIVCFFSPQLL